LSREILVRAPNWLGDLVMSTPAFRALRAACPDDRITLHAREALLPVLGGAPWFDALLPLRSGGGAAAILAEGRSLRSRARFDLGICMPDSWSSALIMSTARVRRVVGYRRAGRGILLSHALEPVARSQGRRFIARERHALGLVAAVGAVSDDTTLELFTTAAEEERAQAALRGVGLESGGFVALAPGASYGSAKQWPAASFARVADAVDARGLAACLIGAPGEESVCAEVLRHARGAVFDLAGRLDPGALKAVLRRARVLVCNDAGARHVAVAFGVPCIVLLGPTSLEKTDCNLEGVHVIETDVDCRPCYERVCPIDHRCMTRLGPERVLDRLEGLLVGPLTPKRGPRAEHSEEEPA